MRQIAVSALTTFGVSLGLAALLLACASNSGTSASLGDGGIKPSGNDASLSLDAGVDSTSVSAFDGGDGGGRSDASPAQGDAGAACEGYQCQVHSCATGPGTTITGTIMDPAGANPINNVLVFVPKYDPSDPNSTIEPIQGGVNFPSGVTCDSCGYLYTGDPVALGVSGTDGTFTIPNAPVGKNIPLVVQIGKWRTHTTVPTVTACQPNSAGTISLPSQGSSTDPVISIPQIAVSTGSADTLECFLLRVGLDPSEYVSGPGGSGHIHLYTGGGPTGGSSGTSEPGSTAPASSTSLWDSVGHLSQYDITLLSCEGGETYNAIPANLDEYVNGGGRVFASHYHYAWFTDPTESGQSYSPPNEWSNVATWQTGSDSTSDAFVGGAVVTALNSPSGGAFPKGEAMQVWLQGVGALGTPFTTGSTPANGANDLAIGEARFNANVAASNAPSQPWIIVDSTTLNTTAGDTTNGFNTSYFSFNAPVTALAPPDGGAPAYCGRVVYSALHGGGGIGNADRVDQSGTTPSGCNPGAGQLSAQEKAIEYMLFDLSSCVTPDTSTPGIPIAAELRSSHNGESP